MITIEQSRGARGLLGWTQQDLADASGLSKTAINNFEKQNSDIKHDSLRAIRTAFEAMGVVFLGEDGVRRVKDQAHILAGAHSLSLLTESIIHTLRNTADDRAGTLHIMGLQDHHLPYLSQIQSQDIAVRALYAQKSLSTEQNIQAPGSEYRHAAHTGPALFIYNGHVAVEFYDSRTIALLESQETFKSERKNFEKLWSGAHIAPEKKSLGETGW